MSYCHPAASGSATYNHDGTILRCDHCGSLHPDEFMARVEGSARVTPTDKNYKAYVGPRIGNAEREEKFYYEHLSEAQKLRFVEMYNEILGEETDEDGTEHRLRRLRLEYPYRFYVLPYFMGMTAHG